MIFVTIGCSGERNESLDLIIAQGWSFFAPTHLDHVLCFIAWISQVDHSGYTARLLVAKRPAQLEAVVDQFLFANRHSDVRDNSIEWHIHSQHRPSR